MNDRYRVFNVRRLFMDDIDKAVECYKCYDFLHLNPVDRQFLTHVMLCGQLWAVFDGEKMVGCSYMLPAQCKAFAQLNAAWEISDLLDDDLTDYLVCGYIWADESMKNKNIYSALCRLWHAVAPDMNKSMLLHYTPAHTWLSMPELLHSGMKLVGLRGLDKLVPHYIFTGTVGKFTMTENKSDTKYCHLSDTKMLSRLCEHGWHGVDISDDNIIFTPGR